ncbi:EthD family reductase [Saccharopolyspora erythraea]|uniref:EthD family reductase n=1 Tax=Saccharopolyspora erythraea TaxID=1836 RepID=UPI001BAE3F65|nr:EthD family reductase [Saccharopolyspora erythraea]QUH02073.1 EthD family reductase [Saccharopolyspora erythraea]
MYNLVLLASRPPDWTHEQFIEWWRGEHAELTYRLPGLRAWRHTDVDSALESRSQGWDGVSVLSFDSEEDLRTALASPEWAAAVAQVGDMRGRRIAVMGHEREMYTG